MSTDTELPVEEVAARLGLPVGMLIRRIEAGDIPARTADTGGEARYLLRLSDLGITAEEAAIFQSNQSSASPARTEPRSIEVTGHIADDASPPATADLHDAATGEEAGSGSAVRMPAELQPAGAEPLATSARAAVDAAEGILEAEADADVNGDSIEDSVPPPSARRPPDLIPKMSIVESPEGPRADLANMTIDPRELVAGLLDRWERTLEQRIYSEQRQRFEAELNNRLHQVKELQVELQSTRAEHAAIQAEKDRALAEKERELAHRERALAEERSKPKRRGWFSRS